MSAAHVFAACHGRLLCLQAKLVKSIIWFKHDLRLACNGGRQHTLITSSRCYQMASSSLCKDTQNKNTLSFGSLAGDTVVKMSQRRMTVRRASGIGVTKSAAQTSEMVMTGL